MPSNKSFAFLSIIFTVVFLLGNDRGVAQETIPYRSDRILIIPKAGRENALATVHGIERAKVRRAYRRLANIHVLQLPPGIDAAAVVERYRRSGCVQAAELDYYLQPAVAPNDPSYTIGTLYGLNNYGQSGLRPDADIDAPEGWDYRTAAASNIVVAVIDSGIRYTHEDLAANMWFNAGETGIDSQNRNKRSNGVDDDGNGYIDDVYGLNVFDGPANSAGDPMDDRGHGTHIAGIIGAVGNNGVGVAGVAWQIRLMACRFFGATGGGTFADAVEAISYARDNGARIINLSVEATVYSAILYSAIQACISSNVIVVAASGNSGVNLDSSPRYPAAYDLTNIVSVLATDGQDGLPSYSNYGLIGVDIGAPGSGIFTTGHLSDSHYTFDTGTSMAAPYVVGALALVWSSFPQDPYWKIIQRIMAASDPIPSLTGRCASGGRLNLRNALHPQPVLVGSAVPGLGQFVVRLRQGAPQQTYIIKASPNLRDWTPISTNVTGADGRALVIEMKMHTTSRFYRAEAVDAP